MHVKLNPALSAQKHNPKKIHFSQQIWLRINEEISKILHLKHSFQGPAQGCRYTESSVPESSFSSFLP